MTELIKSRSRKPYRTASIDSLRRWIKETFAEANLIVNFTPVGAMLKRFSNIIKKELLVTKE